MKIWTVNDRINKYDDNETGESNDVLDNNGTYKYTGIRRIMLAKASSLSATLKQKIEWWYTELWGSKKWHLSSTINLI